MVSRSGVSRTFEEWSPVAFLVAGGLFVLPPVAAGLNATTGTEIAVSPAAIFAFLVVVFVGLLGLYPRLAERGSTLARGGVGLLAATTATTIPALGVFVGPTELLVGEATALGIVLTVSVGATLTVATFGVASLRAGAHSRLVGGFLLVMAASISFMVVVVLADGHSAPDWVSVVVNGLVALSLVSVGSVLRTGVVPAETADSTGDVAAD